MSKKFSFTQSDLDDMILEALNAEPTKSGDKSAKPNILEKLLTRKQLNTGKANERIQY